jgi:hypothetical protein
VEGPSKLLRNEMGSLVCNGWGGHVGGRQVPVLERQQRPKSPWLGVCEPIGRVLDHHT